MRFFRGLKGLKRCHSCGVEQRGASLEVRVEVVMGCCENEKLLCLNDFESEVKHALLHVVTVTFKAQADIFNVTKQKRKKWHFKCK